MATHTHKIPTVRPSEDAVWGKRRIGARFQELLAPAGISLNGGGPRDIRVLDDRFYTHALPRGELGILDAYVAGWWETHRLDELTASLLTCGTARSTANRGVLWLANVSARLLNQGSRERPRRVRRHYNLGNDLFQSMLDPLMVYTCAYWNGAATLDQAQEKKLDLVCRKIGLKPGMRVLDIGCGWGGFARYAAEKYGASVVGITISEEQYSFAKSLCSGFPVSLRVQDYRDVEDDPFDAVVALGMFENVGHKNYPVFIRTARQLLKAQGLFLLHTIGRNTSAAFLHPWIRQNVFPSGMLPSARQIAAAAEGEFVIEDWHNFGPDYDRTLLAWFENFQAHWPRLRDKYGDRFCRMWKCYLLTCAGAFRTRDLQLWQVVMSPRGVPGGYASER